MFLFKKRDSARHQTIERLYGVIVAQARKPIFYKDYEVPDTVEGRFDFLVLHMHLVNERLAAVGEAGAALGQELLDHFFQDMEGSLREIGIGDLTVPKKMRTLAEAYLGRAAVYGEAIRKSDEPELAKALARNVLGSEEADKGRALAAYAFAAAKGLQSQTPETLLAGNVSFPDAEKAPAYAG